MGGHVDLRDDGTVVLPDGVVLRMPTMGELRTLRAKFYEVNDRIAASAADMIEQGRAVDERLAELAAVTAPEDEAEHARALHAARAEVRAMRQEMSDSHDDARAGLICDAAAMLGETPLEPMAWMADPQLPGLLFAHWMNAPLGRGGHPADEPVT